MTNDDTDALLADYGQQLSAAVAEALPGWVVAAVSSRLDPATSPSEAMTAAARAGDAAASELGEELRQLLALDIDQQHTNPLAILRRAVRYPTEVLSTHGVPSVERDADAERLHPDDPYDLTPGAFGDFGPAVHEAGVAWGAAKAHVHLRRRREEGKR